MEFSHHTDKYKIHNFDCLHVLHSNSFDLTISAIHLTVFGQVFYVKNVKWIAEIVKSTESECMAKMWICEIVRKWKKESIHCQSVLWYIVIASPFLIKPSFSHIFENFSKLLLLVILKEPNFSAFSQIRSPCGKVWNHQIIHQFFGQIASISGLPFLCAFNRQSFSASVSSL